MKTDQQSWWDCFIYLEKAHDPGRTGNWLNTYQLDFLSEALLLEGDFNMVSPSNSVYHALAFQGYCQNKQPSKLETCNPRP